MEIVERIAQEWLGEENPIVANKSLVVALSGGVDSVVLLHMLMVISRAHGRESRLSAIHVNHQLHNEADAQSDFCRQLCASLSVGCQVLTVDWSEASNQQLLSDQGVESAARQCRYALLAQSAQCDETIVVTAHHQNDQVETCLLNLARGSGLSGLSGMSSHAQLAVSGNALQLWRPLLSVVKPALQRYAEHHQLSWVEDPTNSDTTLRRNFLRREIMPRLEGEWPAFTQAASRSVRHLQDARAVMDEFTADWLGDFAAPDVLPLSRLNHYSDQRTAWLIRAWLLSTGWSAPNTERFNEFVRQITQLPSAVTKGELRYQDAYSGQQHRVIADLGNLWRFPEKYSINDFKPAMKDWRIREQHEHRHQSESTFSWSVSHEPLQEAVQYDWFIGHIDCLGLSDVLDSVGEQLLLQLLQHSTLTMSSQVKLAGQAHHRQLKKVLQERRVPAWMRPYLPTLWIGDQLLWIGAVGWLADASGKFLISGSGVKIEWFCPGVSVNINPRLESLSS